MSVPSDDLKPWQKKLLDQVMLAQKLGKRVVLIPPPRSNLPLLVKLVDPNDDREDDQP